MIRVATLVAASAALVSCSTLPSEQRLIGTWRMPVDEIEDEFGVTHRQSKIAENTLRADHTYIARDVLRQHDVPGRWQLSGRSLTYEFTDRSRGRRIVQRSRVKIVKLSDRKLVVSDDEGRTGEWTRIR